MISTIAAGRGAHAQRVSRLRSGKNSSRSATLHGEAHTGE